MVGALARDEIDARRDDPADDRPRPASRSTSRRRRAPDGAAARSGRCGPPPSPTGTVSLEVRRGEILGLAGLVGSGRTSLARTHLRHRPAARRRGRGSTARRSRIRSPRDAIARGIYLVPEDRKRAGLVLEMPIRENVTLADLLGHARMGLISGAARDQDGGAAALAPGHQGAVGRDAGRDALRRQPAEGGARQVAVDAAAADHLRRADPRHRRRRQERDLRADARPRRQPASPS